MSITVPVSNPWQWAFRLAAACSVAALAGCASAPVYQQPVDVTPPSGSVAVTQAVTIFDTSGSQSAEFADGKATLESLVAAMPDGSYDAGQIQFGGFKREIVEVGEFDRDRLGGAARDAEFLQGTTPLYHVLENDLTDAIGGAEGRAAIVVISDGLVTDGAGRDLATERTLEAARAVAASRSGDTCFHTVQSGNDPAGASLLRSIADVSTCGSFRTAASLDSASALQGFSRQAYLGDGKGSSARRVAAAPAPAPVSAAGDRAVSATAADSDGDGVADPADACPDSLKNARVDARGCWTLRELRFAVDGSNIEAGFATSLGEDIEVLKANPKVRVRVDGHTDSDGSAAYNQGLSERRAASVRDHLVSKGLDADRFEIRGFGEEELIAPNDSSENKRRNRRVELTIID